MTEYSSRDGEARLGSYANNLSEGHEPHFIFLPGKRRVQFEDDELEENVREGQKNGDCLIPLPPGHIGVCAPLV
ncbi:hypothetical protein BC827DRAFT_1213160 [Russula dissimulans]|nr:hypothetical protein BC827DRAFT_1213160 [Russula dissimulans]